MNKLISKIVGVCLGLSLATGVGVGVAVGQNSVQEAKAADTTTTYTFSSKSWAASPANWTSGKDGNQMSSDRGVQITTGATGANATSPKSFSNVSKIVLTYSTNASSGAGSVSFKIGSNTEASQDVTKTGGTTDRSLTYTFSPVQSGSVKMTIACTTNSIYVKSVAITETTSSATLSSVSIGGTMTKTNYLTTDDWDYAGLTATANYSSGSPKDVTSDATWTYSPTSPSSTSTTSVRVTASYSEGGVTKTSYKDVTVTVSEPVARTFSLINSASDLKAGANYVIGGAKSDGSVDFLSSNQATNNRTGVSALVADQEVSLSGSNVEVLTLGGSTSAWTLFANNSETQGYLYASSSSGNQLKTQTTNNTNGQWAITFNSDDSAKIIAQGTNTRNELRYNPNNGSPLFACYANSSTTGTDTYIYKEVILTPSLTMATSLEGNAGESGSLTATPSNFSGTPTYSWSSSNTSAVTVSGNGATASLSYVAGGTSTISVTATYNSETATASCEVTVFAIPTALQIKVNGNVVSSDFVLEQYEGRTRKPTVVIQPEGANQSYVAELLSESATGAFTITGGNTINYNVAGETGVVRFKSTVKNTIFFDLNVACNADEPIANSFAYSGTVATQYEDAKFNPAGLVFTMKFASDPETDKEVGLDDITFSPSVLTTSTTEVVATHKSGQTLTISIEVEELDCVPISSFYDGTIDVSAETSKYMFKGTCIGILGNSYYLQEGDYGIYVYNKATTGLEIGSLVLIESTVTTYNTLVETKTITSATVIGTGSLPAASFVNTLSAFKNVNQSTYITFSDLDGGSVNWTQDYAANSKDGIGTVEDKDGNSVPLFVSKHLGSAGTAIITKLDTLVSTDTFDIARGVKALNTANGVAADERSQLSILDANQITIHHAGEDRVQSWIDEYLYMNDSSFSGNGTGRCLNDNLYLTAKRALIALGNENVSKFQNNTGSLYTAALARYNAWASACGDTSPFAGNNIVPASRAFFNIDSNSAAIPAIVVVIALATVTTGAYFFLRKKKEN